MTDLDHGSTGGSATGEPAARVLGWLAGLGLLVVPVIVAGVLATIGTMVGPESWSAERTFPWLLLVAFVADLCCLVYGSVRISGFRRGALRGAAIALLVGGGIYTLGAVLAR